MLVYEKVVTRRSP